VSEIDDCCVHHRRTLLQIVAVVDVLKPGLKASPAYVKARREGFPNSNDVMTGRGAWRSARRTCVAVCEECCRQRDAYLVAHYPLWSKTHDLAS